VIRHEAGSKDEQTHQREKEKLGRSNWETIEARGLTLSSFGCSHYSWRRKKGSFVIVSIVSLESNAAGGKRTGRSRYFGPERVMSDEYRMSSFSARI
jgi:hypothetical protein